MDDEQREAWRFCLVTSDHANRDFGIKRNRDDHRKRVERINPKQSDVTLGLNHRQNFNLLMRTGTSPRLITGFLLMLFGYGVGNC